jgi:hypothetical protein
VGASCDSIGFSIWGRLSRNLARPRPQPYLGQIYRRRNIVAPDTDRNQTLAGSISCHVLCTDALANMVHVVEARRSELMVQECSTSAAELLLGRFLALGCYIRFMYSSDGVEGAYQMDGSDIREVTCTCRSDQERIQVRHEVRVEYQRRVRAGTM